jgi:hypothetical protein
MQKERKKHWLQDRTLACGCGNWSGADDYTTADDRFEKHVEESVFNSVFVSYGSWTHNHFTDELVRDEEGTEVFILKE